MFEARKRNASEIIGLAAFVLNALLASAVAQEVTTPTPQDEKPTTSAKPVQSPPKNPPSKTKPAETKEDPQKPTSKPPGKVSIPNLAPSPLTPLNSPQSPFSNLQLPPGRRPFLSRLSRTPDLFGDFNTLSVASVQDVSHNQDPWFPVVDVPGGGASRRYKNEHARALPTDRAFVFFNHFHNATTIRSPGGSGIVQGDINQFTFGFERTFGDGDWSAEFRLPISTGTELSNGVNSARSDGVGNLVVTLKNLLYADSEFAAALGLAVTAPTGSDAGLGILGSQITFENEAVHMLPYLALQAAPDENWFFHAFAQVDVPANADGIEVFNTFTMTRSTGRIVGQTLVFLDASAGYWWLKNDEPEGLTGVASVVELHYSGALNDAHTANVGTVAVGNLDNRFDVVNLTIGLHTEWQNDTAIRFATVVPLRSHRNPENRFFDTEFQLSLVRKL